MLQSLLAYEKNIVLTLEEIRYLMDSKYNHIYFNLFNLSCLTFVWLSSQPIPVSVNTAPQFVYKCLKTLSSLQL